MAIDKEHLYITIGGVIASGAIAYLIYRMQTQNAAANTDAQIAASEEETQQEQSYISQLPSISASAPSATTTYSSAGDVATGSTTGTPATDDELEALIASFSASPLNSVVLQSTPVAIVNPLAAPGQQTVAPVTIPTLNASPGPSGVGVTNNVAPLTNSVNNSTFTSGDYSGNLARNG
jgi:hypothetical protein